MSTYMHICVAVRFRPVKECILEETSTSCQYHQ